MSYLLVCQMWGKQTEIAWEDDQVHVLRMARRVALICRLHPVKLANWTLHAFHGDYKAIYFGLSASSQHSDSHSTTTKCLLNLNNLSARMELPRSRIGPTQRLSACCEYLENYTFHLLHSPGHLSFVVPFPPPNPCLLPLKIAYPSPPRSDVDGTLSKSRLSATPEMIQLLRNLRKVCVTAFVGGSDLAKIAEQLAPDGHDGE